MYTVQFFIEYSLIGNNTLLDTIRWNNSYFLVNNYCGNIIFKHSVANFPKAIIANKTNISYLTDLYIIIQLPSLTETLRIRYID